MKNFLCLNLHEYPLTSSVQMKTRESGGEANLEQLDCAGRRRAQGAAVRAQPRPLLLKKDRDKLAAPNTSASPIANGDREYLLELLYSHGFC